MRRIMKTVRAFWVDEAGLETVEDAVITGLIGFGTVAPVCFIGGRSGDDSNAGSVSNRHQCCQKGKNADSGNPPLKY